MSQRNPRGLCTEKIDGFNFRELLAYFEFRLSSRSAIFFFICCPSRKPITRVDFKFVAKQVEASVVIRATGGFNLQCNKLRDKLKKNCGPYYLTFTLLLHDM